MFIGRCHRAGVRIVAGTDGPGSLAPGFGLHYELALLVRAGLSPVEALRAATYEAAAALGRDRELGSIARDKRADLVIVGADPTIDIRIASRIEAVVLRGKLLDRRDLDAIIERAAARARDSRNPS